MKRLPFVLLLLAAWTAAFATQPVPAAEPAKSTFENFITRRGNKLYDGEQEFRFMGANMPGLVLPYDWTLYLPERLHLPTPWEQEDAFKTLDQMNLRVVRTWNLPVCGPDDKPQPWHYVLGPGKFSEEAFKTIDHLFALANKYRVRVILDLTAESGDYLGGISQYAAHRGKKRKEFYTDPQVKEDYKATLRYVLNRVNTVSGVPYREDKAVLAWQFGNEMHGAPDAWLAEMATYLKSLDPNHLVAETRHRPGQPLMVDPNIDMVTRHLYGNYRGVEGGWPAAMRKEMEKLAGQRPMFIGEFGPYIDGKMFTLDNVVGKLQDLLDYVQNEPGISGALIWSMYFHHNEGGYYWHQIMTYPAVWSYHWPGFPSAEAQREQGIMQAMREAAFRIQGMSTPPLPTPDAPELLPIGDVPLLTWRGSAGATGYDIERAAQASGPWAVVANDVCDADIAYRPLFSDTSASVGASYFYRVVARNQSGRSRPSNVVGPVAVKQVCFVDELQDFSQVAAKSDGLRLNNAYNALYAEYLFRAQGKSGDWLAYEVPGQMESIKVTVFCNSGEVADLKLQVGDTTLQPKRAERVLPRSPGGATRGQGRTMITYECNLPPGHSRLKIVWSGAAELDRVEIYMGKSQPVAKTTTEYVQQSVIYQIHPRVFTKEGTLKAAETHLPRLAKLGVDILYLLPVFVSDDDMDPAGWSSSQKASGMNNPRNPYRMKDYFNVDPEYGTNQDLQDFVDKAHRLGMKVMLDVVYYHCGPNAVFLKDHPDFVKRDKDGKIFTGRWNFPVINHADPELREYLIKNMEYWARDFHVDGFRADVASSVPLAFWEAARERLEEINPEIIMLAEGFKKDNQLKAFDLDYQFSWYQTLQRIYQDKSPASDVRKTWSSGSSQSLPGTRWVHYLESHDTTCKTLDWKRPNKIWGTDVVDTALVLNFTVDGVPWLYNGQEVADTTRHNIHAVKGSLVIDWPNAETPGGKARFAPCQQLCKMRHTERALTHGELTWLDNSAPDEIVSFLRTTKDEQILTVVNMKKKDVDVVVEMPAGTAEYQALLSRGVKSISRTKDKLTVVLEGCGYFVGKRKQD